MTRALDVLAIGELNPDLVLSGLDAPAPVLGTEQLAGAYRLSLGSATALCTVALARLGLRTALVARVGDDEYGHRCLGWLRAEGVDVSGVVPDPALATGLCVSVAYTGDRLLLTVPGAIAALAAADVPEALIDQARHLHVSSWYLQPALQPGLAALLRGARRRGLTTSLDPGWDPARQWASPALDAVLAEIDVFLPNESELQAIGAAADLGRAAAAVLARGAGAVAVKRGAAGAMLFDAAGAHAVPGFATVAVDTTGAGDNFNAGYLFGMLAGWPVARRLRLGNACGAMSVRQAGGVGGYAGLDEVERFAAGAAA